MDPIKSRQELLREIYLFTCGLLVAIALIAPIAENISAFWTTALVWAFDASFWFGFIYLVFFMCVLPGMIVIATRIIMSGVDPVEKRINDYFRIQGTSPTEASDSEKEV